MQLRLNANELTLNRKWLYAPLAANSKAIMVTSIFLRVINLLCIVVQEMQEISHEYPIMQFFSIFRIKYLSFNC